MCHSPRETLVTAELRHAREEVLKSLASTTAFEERDHRRLARHHTKLALNALRLTASAEIDWSDVIPR